MSHWLIKSFRHSSIDQFTSRKSRPARGRSAMATLRDQDEQLPNVNRPCNARRAAVVVAAAFLIFWVSAASTTPRDSSDAASRNNYGASRERQQDQEGANSTSMLITSHTDSANEFQMTKAGEESARNKDNLDENICTWSPSHSSDCQQVILKALCSEALTKGSATAMTDLEAPGRRLLVLGDILNVTATDTTNTTSTPCHLFNLLYDESYFPVVFMDDDEYPDRTSIGCPGYSFLENRGICADRNDQVPPSHREPPHTTIANVIEPLVMSSSATSPGVNISFCRECMRCDRMFTICRPTRSYQTLMQPMHTAYAGYLQTGLSRHSPRQDQEMTSVKMTTTTTTTNALSQLLDFVPRAEDLWRNWNGLPICLVTTPVANQSQEYGHGSNNGYFYKTLKTNTRLLSTACSVTVWLVVPNEQANRWESAMSTLIRRHGAELTRTIFVRIDVNDQNNIYWYDDLADFLSRVLATKC